MDWHSTNNDISNLQNSISKLINQSLVNTSIIINPISVDNNKYLEDLIATSLITILPPIQPTFCTLVHQERCQDDKPRHLHANARGQQPMWNQMRYTIPNYLTLKIKVATFNSIVKYAIQVLLSIASIVKFPILICFSRI